MHSLARRAVVLVLLEWESGASIVQSSTHGRDSVGRRLASAMVPLQAGWIDAHALGMGTAFKELSGLTLDVAR